METPKDLFKFVEDNQEEINAFTRDFADFLRQRQSNPYCVLASLTNIVTFIIETSFLYADDADHLRFLIEQTLEAYQNAILMTAEDIMYGRFNQSLLDEDDEFIEDRISRC